MVVVYEYDEDKDLFGVVTVQNARSSTAATSFRAQARAPDVAQASLPPNTCPTASARTTLRAAAAIGA